MGTIDFTDSIYDAQQGNQSSIKFIYDNTIQMFRKEADVLMRNESDADIAIRDAYLFLFSHLDSLEDTSRFLLWANEVCKNTCISKLKQINAFDDYIPAEAANLGEVLPASDFESMVNMQARMIPDHVRICLDAVLDALPDSQRVCAVLWGEGYPIHSIARKLGLNAVAVNYILACTLGSITNAVTTLSENGLPLYQMEPIPFFLWLLMIYYQDCDLGDPAFEAESSFLNVLKILLPDEAPLFMTDFYAADKAAEDEFFAAFDAAQQSVAVEPGYEESLYSSSTDIEFDLEGFINADRSGSQPAESKAPAEADSDTDNEAVEDNGEPEDPDGEDDGESEDENEDEDDEAEDENDEDGDESEDEDDEDGDESEDEDDEDGDESEDEDDEDDVIPAPPMDVFSAEGGSHTEGETTPDDLTDVSAFINADSSGESQPKASDSEFSLGEIMKDLEPQAEEKKKGHKGLIITLIVIILLLLIAGAAYFRHSDVISPVVNGWIGRDILPVVNFPGQNTDTGSGGTAVPETTTGPESTAETTTEAPTETSTEPETTTEAPTEPETTTEEVVGPDYTARIYDDWEGSLAMYAGPSNNTERLTYVPLDEEVYITETSDGWGHISYDGYDGWIWLGYTKVSGKAPVQKPEADMILAEPELRTSSGGELRIAPGNSSSTYGFIPDGTELTVEAYDYGMYNAYTSFEGNYGWIAVDNLY